MQLLEALDALVNSDAQKPMLRGKVTLGVRGKKGYRFWSASFDGAAVTTFADTMPADSTVTLFIDETDATHILTTGRMPARPKLLSIDGERALMTRFLNRYTGGANVLRTRIATMGAAAATQKAASKVFPPAIPARPSRPQPQAHAR
jgi:hypothetical protein